MNNFLTLVATTVVVAGILACAGCGTTGSVLGSQQVIERSGDMPDWATAIPDDDADMYFRGLRSGAVRLDDGLTDARMHAARQVAESILTDANIDYRRARIENGRVASIPGDVPALVKDGLIMLADAVQQGVRERESYWEKLEEVTHNGLAYKYNVFTLVRISKEDYRATAGRILGQQIEKARASHDAEAEKYLKEMWRRIEK